MMRAACLLWGLLAIGLLGFAGYHFVADRDPPSGESVVVHDPDRDLGSQECERVISVRFHITNKSSQPMRILGLMSG